MFFDFLIAQFDATGIPPGNPWWLTAITGSGGALIVLMLWVRNLSAQIKAKDQELLQISKDSIECIAKIIEKKNQEESWKHRVENLLSHINQVLDKINRGR
jgi:hypothetical protein